MEKVSIIVPVYNAELYIERCINSIINQTYKNIELILFDDGSLDASLELMKVYERKYDFIKVYSHDNSGVAITRNEALRKTTGYYIMYIDNDDYIDSDYVEKFVNKIEETASDIVVGGYKRVNKNKKIMFQYTPQNDDWQKYIVVAPWAKIYKKEVLIKYDAKFMNYYIGEDVYFSLNLYSQNLKINYIKYNGYNWFFNTSSVSNTSQKGFNKKIDITFVTERLLEFYSDSNTENAYLMYYIYKYFIWYLLFSGRNADSCSLVDEYEKMKAWYQANINKKVRIPKSEPFKFKVIVTIMTIVFKLHLITLFSKFYCKGTETK